MAAGPADTLWVLSFRICQGSAHLVHSFWALHIPPGREAGTWTKGSQDPPWPLRDQGCEPLTHVNEVEVPFVYILQGAFISLSRAPALESLKQFFSLTLIFTPFFHTTVPLSLYTVSHAWAL